MMDGRMHPLRGDLEYVDDLFLERKHGHNERNDNDNWDELLCTSVSTPYISTAKIKGRTYSSSRT
jgi:hypothetical protein